MFVVSKKSFFLSFQPHIKIFFDRMEKKGWIGNQTQNP